MYKYLGIIGPVIFFSMAFIISMMLPEYNSQTQMISELGATGAPYYKYFNYFGFLPNGICIALFGMYFFTQLKKHTFNPTPAILIIIHGLGMVLATWFSCDISCTPQDPSFKQIIHNVLAAFKFPALHLAVIIFAIQLLKRSNNKFAYFSIFIFLTAGILMALFTMSVQTRVNTGIYQRLFIASIYIWLSVIAYNIKSIMAHQTLKKVINYARSAPDAAAQRRV